MDAAEIWKLVLKADERLKYTAGTDDPRRREQAAGMLLDALAAAEELGNEGLVGQIKLRLEDLDQRP